MYEVELKVQADHGPVRERLRDRGATPERAVVQADTYYDAPDRSFAETDEALRIRRESPGSFPGDRQPDADRDGTPVARLTYKGPLVDDSSKTREELETRVDDDEELAAILRSLGYDPVATVRKDREVYALEGFEVTLDDVEGVGEFVEVDASVPESEVPATRERARSLLEGIGLDPEEGIRTSYLGMVLEGSE